MTLVEVPRVTVARPGIDAELWPDVATVPRSCGRAAIARRIFRRAAGVMALRVVHPDVAQLRRPGRSAGDPAGRLHGAGHARHLHLDPQIHLSGRPTRLGRGDRPHDCRTHRAAHRGSVGVGRHYADTLRRWRARFEEQADVVDALGFDETFRRMWSRYLAYSEAAGFRTGCLDVTQLTLTKPGR